MTQVASLQVQSYPPGMYLTLLALALGVNCLGLGYTLACVRHPPVGLHDVIFGVALLLFGLGLLTVALLI